MNPFNPLSQSPDLAMSYNSNFYNGDIDGSTKKGLLEPSFNKFMIADPEEDRGIYQSN